MSLRSIIHKCMVEGQGTRDLCGPEGLTTEQFVEVVAKRLDGAQPQPTTAPQLTTHELAQSLGCDGAELSRVEPARVQATRATP